MMLKHQAVIPLNTLKYLLIRGFITMGRVEKTLPNRLSLDETFDVGFDTGTPVTEAYETPFDFTGNLEQITINLDS
jgi:arylsulfatase